MSDKTPAARGLPLSAVVLRKIVGVPVILNVAPGTGMETRNAVPVPDWQSVQWHICVRLRIGLAFDPDGAAGARAVDFHCIVPSVRVFDGGTG